MTELDQEMTAQIKGTLHVASGVYAPYYLEQLAYLDHIIHLASPQFRGATKPFEGFGIHFHKEAFHFNGHDPVTDKPLPEERFEWSKFSKPVEVFQKHVFAALLELRAECVETLRILGHVVK